MILNEIRKARELYSGPELAAELSRIQQRLDNVECLSVDIVINLLLTYRDIQVSPSPSPGGSHGVRPPPTTAALRLLNHSWGQPALRMVLNYSAGCGLGGGGAAMQGPQQRVGWGWGALPC